MAADIEIQANRLMREIKANRLMREIKRLELQVARLRPASGTE
jgi:hypothetical protein